MSLAEGVARRVLFEVWKQERVSDRKHETIINYLSDNSDFQNYDREVQCKIRKAINNLCAELKKKWLKCHRNEQFFSKTFGTWLAGKITFNLKQKKVSPGRPSKNFDDCAVSSKRNKIQHLVTTASTQELAYATRLSMHSHGNRNAAEIVKQVSAFSPTRATRMKRSLRQSVNMPQKMSPDQALALYTDTKMTRNQYNRIKHNSKDFNANIYPNYNKILDAKKKCYPDGIHITDISAEVSVQALVDHTVKRLATAQADLLNHVYSYTSITSIKIVFKWGCDGAAGQSRYKQRYESEISDDAFLFSISLVPLQMIAQTNEKDEIIIFQNKCASSTNYCRPIKIIFKHEKEDFVKREIENIKLQIQNLTTTTIQVSETINLECTAVFSLTMIDGKICSWLTNTSFQNCHLCNATPKIMNNIEAMKAREIVEDNANLGISSLHAWIKCFECLLHISYRLGIQKWSVRAADKQTVLERKKLIQENLRREMGLLVDIPKPGFGTTNDGNTSRRFFRDPATAASITGISENLIKRLHNILITISCGLEIDNRKFEDYCLRTAKLYVQLYPWYYMPQSLHKILIHGGVLVNKAVLPIGQMSEEAQEARNKDAKNFREHHARKFSRKQTLEDMMHMLLVTSDPFITSLRSIKSRKRQSIPKEVIMMLKEPQIQICSSSEDSE